MGIWRCLGEGYTYKVVYTPKDSSGECIAFVQADDTSMASYNFKEEYAGRWAFITSIERV